MSDLNLTNRYRIKSNVTGQGGNNSYSPNSLVRFSLHSDHPEDLEDFLDFILSENDIVMRLSEFFESVSEDSGVST